MTINVPKKTIPETCLSCANLMKSENSSSGLRCGYTYFSQPPAERKQERMEHYPETLPDDHCKYWTESHPVLN